MTQHRFKVGPHEIAATISGPASAPIFILVHGIGVSSRYFAPLTAELSHTFRVVTLDLPGFGASSNPGHALSIKELADIVTALIDQQEWRQPILVGHSMGCQIVSLMIAEHPTLFTKAALLSPTVNPCEHTIWLQGLRLLQDTFHEPLAANLIVFHDYLFRCGPLRYLATSRHMIADHIEDRLSSCPANTLVIRGTRDHIAPHDWATTMAQLLPNASLHEIPGAPHIVQFTHPREITQLCVNLASQP